MKSGRLATWTVLLQFHTVRIVATVLLGDVVALFAVNTCHCDFRADIRALACHVDSLVLLNSRLTVALELRREDTHSPNTWQKRSITWLVRAQPRAAIG